jgi:predicted phage gp36 major capsid-like protein
MDRQSMCPARTASGDNAMSDEQRAMGEHYRDIAEKIRQIARQSDIPRIRQEVFELADRLHRMAEVAEGASFGRTKRSTPRKS